MDSFAVTIAEETDRYLALWSETPPAFPDSLRRFSPSARSEKMKEVEILIEKTIPRLDRYDEMDGGERDRYLGRAHTALGRLMTGEGDPGVNRFFEECESAGKLFVRRAREHDPALSDDDIHQALRNQWVFNSVQSSLSHPVTLTSSSLGYSLMYPCTDNLLDAPALTRGEKIRFNSALASLLDGNGDRVDPADLRGFPALLEMIEEEYPRGTSPDVYRSLCAIHRAQQGSLILHGSAPDRPESFLQSLTIEKGGASVVVDGVLVSGALAPGALHAFFGYGVVLQFIDDLQDIPDDAAAGHSTMFTRLCREGPSTRSPAGSSISRAARSAAWTVCPPRRSAGFPGLSGGAASFSSSKLLRGFVTSTRSRFSPPLRSSPPSRSRTSAGCMTGSGPSWQPGSIPYSPRNTLKGRQSR